VSLSAWVAALFSDRAAIFALLSDSILTRERFAVDARKRTPRYSHTTRITLSGSRRTNPTLATKTLDTAIVRNAAFTSARAGTNADVTAIVLDLTACLITLGVKLDAIAISRERTACLIRFGAKVDETAMMRPIPRENPTPNVEVAAIVLSRAALLEIAAVSVVVAAIVRP
jgi:hypothetical protein